MTLGQEQDGFPYRWTDDSRAPYRERVRLEESPWLTPWSAVAYRRKHAQGRWRYPSALVDHFRNATGLTRPAAGLAPGGGRRLRIAAVGDLMWQRTAGAPYLTPPLLEHLASADLVLLNLETVIDPTRRHRQHGLVPRFSAGVEYLAPLLELARRTKVVAQVANNHCLDQGHAGLRATLKQLAAVGIPVVGAALPGGDPAAILEVAGARVGILAFTSVINRPWATWRAGLGLCRCRGLARGRGPSLAPVLAAAGRLRDRGAQVVLAGLHWGHEYELLPDPHQLRVARALAAAGVDAVFGHHAHLAQPVELLECSGGRVGRLDPARPSAGARRALIAYGLGNFVSNMVRPDWSVGLLAEVTVRVDGSGPGELDGYAVRPLLVHPLGQQRGCAVGLLDQSGEGHPAAALHAAARVWWDRLGDLSLLDGEDGRQLQGPRHRWAAAAERLARRPGAVSAAAGGLAHG